MHDLVIRNATVVDGTGAPPTVGDVAVDEGRITSVGDDTGRGHREVDGDGLLLAPGWVDIHTHYDGQVTWDPDVTPSSWHGVTTVVMGNCGVGFAPVRPGGQDFLIELMEGVEDIPGSALHEGIDWTWESFPEYLDALEAMPRAIDVGAHLPHAPVRAYVLGDRCNTDYQPNAEEIAQMAALVREGVAAGHGHPPADRRTPDRHPSRPDVQLPHFRRQPDLQGEDRAAAGRRARGGDAQARGARGPARRGQPADPRRRRPERL